MKWSIPIIAVALMVTILVGSLGFQDVIRQTTEYDSVLTDLAPIADAEPVTGTVNYNPLTNVTGWGGGVSYKTQTEASLYRIYQENTITEETTTYALNDLQKPSGGVNQQLLSMVLPEPEARRSYTWERESATPDYRSTDVDLNRYSNNFMGGWIGDVTYTFEDPILFYRSYSSAMGVTIMDGTEPAGSIRPDGDTAYFVRVGPEGSGYNIIAPIITLPEYSIVTAGVSRGMGMVGGSWNGQDGYSYIVQDFKEFVGWDAAKTTEALMSGEFIYTNGVWFKITGYTIDGAPVWDDSISCPYMIIINDTFSYTLSYKVWERGEVYYITPHTTATISNAVWNNGQTNEKIVFIADAANFNYGLNGRVPSAALSASQPDMAAWISGYSGKIQITVSSDGTAYWQGITSYSDTKNYTVSEYRYRLTAPENVSTGPIQTLNIVYFNGATGGAAVIDTWVPQDGSGLLWQNATFPINTVFSSLWTSENLRVQFNSFVTTGTGITINGVTYPVNDGIVTVDEDSFKLAGSAIKWTSSGDTTLVSPGGKSYDLGERSGTFTLNGVWYGAISLDTFEVVDTPGQEAVFGIIPEVGWLAWVFLGIIVVGAIAILATGRQLDVMDIFALAIVGVLGIFVAVI